jgi:hypothetical protein
MADVVVTLPSYSAYIQAENGNYLLAENLDYLTTEDQPGVQSIVYLGLATAQGEGRATVSGVQAVFTLGSVVVTADGIVPVTGVQAVGQIGSVLVWGLVNTSQTPNWTQIIN